LPNIEVRRAVFALPARACPFFKKEFRQAIRPALAVYPDARVEEVAGGILLRPSQPPMPKTQVSVLA
jgi:hypothetical protein